MRETLDGNVGSVQRVQAVFTRGLFRRQYGALESRSPSDALYFPARRRILLYIEYVLL